MTEIQAPGVRILHVLTEPARVLRTGVPVFLGLVSAAAIREWNAVQEVANEQFICVPLGPQAQLGAQAELRAPADEGPALEPDPCGCDDSNLPAIVRKRGYLELPGRAAPPAREAQIGDRSANDSSMHMRVVQPARRLLSEGNRSKVLSSAGAAGPVPARSRAASSAGDAAQDTASGDGPLLVELSRKPQRFTMWPQFRQTYSDLAGAGFLSFAVRGFFENGGMLCYVQVIAYDTMPGDPADVVVAAITNALCAGLVSLAPYDEYDLLCVPDLLWEEGVRNDVAQLVDLQNAIINHCNLLGDRMAILDATPVTAGAPFDLVTDQRSRLTGANVLCDATVDLVAAAARTVDASTIGANAALYYPWLRVPGGPEQTSGYIPPSGHVAGIYARTDQKTGVHKAPANEVIEGVIDLASHLSDDEQAPLNDVGINCLRAFPHRGIRIWGARTLSRDATWRYVNVRRVILTAVRWITRNMNDVVFEPHSEQLWARITRELTAYFGDLARLGALAGGTTDETFYVKCDAETNPPEVREMGQVITEIGLRPAAPAEFIVIRIIHGPTGAEITTE